MNMQRNRLEQFILENRSAFDTVTPGNHLWGAIEQALDANAKQGDLEQFILQNRAAFDASEPGARSWTAIEQALNATQKHDELEQFVSTHREAFDTAMPRFRVWAEVDKALHPQEKQRTLKVAPIWRVISIAASVLLLLVAGAMVGIYITKTQAADTQRVASLEELSPEYAEMVRYYNEQIDQKVRQVSMQSDDESVLKDLEAIDQTMKDLEAELQKAPKGAEEQIVSNLIRSYQIKVEILERVLNRIQQSKENLNSEDDEISI